MAKNATFFEDMAWCFSVPFVQPMILDDMESYANLAAVGGLNGGSNWNGAYVDHNGEFGVQASDDMESYADGAAVNALNGGAGWNGAYIDR